MSTYTRTLQASPATVSESWYEDGALVDPGVVTLAVEQENGTVLIAAGAATTGSGAAARTYNLTATHTANLDVLKLTWTSATKGTRISYVEVCGGYLASLTDLRAEKPLDSVTNYPTANLITARTVAEIALEHACGVAFVPRYRRESKIDGDGTTEIVLQKPRPLSVTAASIGGTALTLTDVLLYDDGRLYYANGWTTGRQNVSVTYTHGHKYPPGNCGQVVAKLVKWLLVDSPISDRALSVVTSEGQQNLITAGVRNAIFSIPDANAFVDSYGYVRGVG